MQIEAIYEKGVFKPIVPLSLSEGTRVEITLQEMPSETRRTPFQILSEIANLPLEVERQETAGREHDHFLYGATEE